MIQYSGANCAAHGIIIVIHISIIKNFLPNLEMIFSRIDTVLHFIEKISKKKIILTRCSRRTYYILKQINNVIKH